MLEIVYQALPVFGQLIVLYYEEFFDEYKGETPLHNNWMNILDRLVSDNMASALRDYYFCDCGLHNSEVNAIIDGQFLVNSEIKSQISDTLELLNIAGSSDVYKQIKAEMNQSLIDAAQQMKPTLMEYYQEDEADKLITETLMQSLGMAS